MLDLAIVESLEETSKKVNSYIDNCEYFNSFALPEITDGLKAYFTRGGKRIRPALALWACGAVGGDIDKVIPAASGLEACHTWTLIHDDIIDNDDTRRGDDSMHIIGEKFAKSNFYTSSFENKSFGETYSILIGDMLHGISVSMILDSVKVGVSPEIAIEICKLLESNIALSLIEGELLDVKFEYMKLEDINTDLILSMIIGKTAVLIKYAATIGAMIGLNTTDINDKRILALGNFALNIGIAFQLQDDILGLIADEKELGKPVGSDILEGKKTLTAFYALEKFTEEEKTKFLTIFGNSNASPEDVKIAVKMIIDAKALDRTRDMAEDLVKVALKKLSIIEDSKYKELLISFANYMIERKY